MKRLFKIGAGRFIFSIIPILSWIVLSFVLGDHRISNVFSITYAMQFIYSIFNRLFGTAANIRKEKDGDENAVWNGIFWGTIFSAIVFAIPMIFVDKYIIFFGQDAKFYRVFALYSFALLFVQTLFSFIIEKLYFEDKEGKANIHLFAFNLTNFLVLILTALIFKNAIISAGVTLAVLLGYVIVLYILNFKKFKISFKILKNFRYESAEIISAVALLIIYLFGFKNAFAAGEQYLQAINISGLCTDTQWDTMGAIDTVAKVDISKKRYKYKEELFNSYFFTLVLMTSSLIMGFGLALLKNASLKIVAIYLVFQFADMLLYPCSATLSVFTQLEYSPTLNSIINLSSQAIRTILSVVLLTPFCTDIAQLATGFLIFAALIIIRCAKYKLSGNTLTLKSTKNEGEDKSLLQ